MGQSVKSTTSPRFEPANPDNVQIYKKKRAKVESALFERATCIESADGLFSGNVADPLLGQCHAAGSYAMKVLRLIERIAHWIALFLGIVAIVAVGVIIGRPSEKSGNQPNFAGAEQQQKRLAVFLDGTWNSVNSNTNVWRMRALCAAKSKDGRPQLIYYEV